MKGAALFLSLCATQSNAIDLSCTLQNAACFTDCADKSVTFSIDPNQFVAAQNPNDPPRRQVTTVNIDGIRFVAEAIMLSGGILGFHEDAGEIGRRLMIVQPNNTARLSLSPANEVWTGTCTRQP